MDWKADKVRANGIRLHYHRTGGDKLPMLLLHGVTENGLCWTRLATAVSQQYDLIMLDARGHGFSDAPETGYGAAEHAADVISVCEALNLKQPILLGHSMGAMTVANVIAKAPSLASKAILEDPAWRSAADVAAMNSDLSEWRNHLIKAKMLPLETILARGQAENPTWDESEWQPWAMSKHQVNPRVIDGFTPGRYLAWQKLVPQFRCPTLLITADPARGAAVTAETAVAVAALSPHITVAHIPNAGHHIRREQFAAYLNALKKFLAL